MRRWLFKLATAVSPGLCAATVALWIRSYCASDYLSWSSTSRDMTWVGERGQILIRITDVEEPPNPRDPHPLRLNDWNGTDPRWFALDAVKETDLPMEWEPSTLKMGFAAGRRRELGYLSSGPGTPSVLVARSALRCAAWNPRCACARLAP